VICSQRFSSPRRQAAHPPQAAYNHATPTRVPGIRVVTAGPTRSTTPTTWCPGMSGSLASGNSPSTTCRSVWHTPQRTMRTSTSPAPGVGGGRSRHCSGEASTFVPPDRAPEAGEFILVVTRPTDAQLDDAAIRRAVFEQLSIHGVSGFQQDARTTPRVRWYKFEVTGSSGGAEWASVGAVSAGDARYHLIVCAKPLAQWRDGQKQCDQVVKTFQPGPLQ